MKDEIKDFIRIVLMAGICAGSVLMLLQFNIKTHSSHYTASPHTIDTIISIPVFIEKSAEEGLKEALRHYDIVYPEIVYAQAVLETGYFKSEGCLKHHNLFGLYDSKANGYYRFNHWSESVVAYREWIQKRYKPPEDYYKFLSRIGYASDPQYTLKLKQIVKKENDKRRYTERDTLP